MKSTVYALALAFLSFGACAAPLAVHLVANRPSPQPVGTIIGLSLRLENTTRAKYAAQYSVSVDGERFHIIRDFSQELPFTWSPELYEHQARVRVTIRNNDTNESAGAELPFQIVPRTKDSRPVVTPTAHPLVALFSAPPCPQGSHFRVEFRRQGDSISSRTSPEPCRAGRSSNVYVAGMYADSDYQMRSEIVSDKGVESGAWLPFHTGLSDGRFPHVSNPKPHPGGPSVTERLLVRSIASALWRPMATDLDGNLVWYMGSEGFLTRMLWGGRFLVIADGANSANDMKRWQLIRDVDLLGNTVRETNISRVAEQLESRGIKSRCKKDGQQCVAGFHHEAIRLPNGHTLALAGLERMFPDGAQGSKDPVDVLGDLVVDLDEDFQVAWVWNAFDHLDLNRASREDEKCQGGPGDDGCTPVFLASAANGWLHSNALHYIQGRGDLLISVPGQNWIIKIDYHDGKGTGKVLWRLGGEGDFKPKSDDAQPWFSGQHEIGFDPPRSNRLAVFDNGTERKKKDPKANARGQIWELDEENRTAALLKNVDLGVYSECCGSAQLLSNGGYTFEAGFIDPGPTPFSRTTEVAADNTIAYVQQVDGGITYRTFRVPDLYTPPKK